MPMPTPIAILSDRLSPLVPASFLVVGDVDIAVGDVDVVIGYVDVVIGDVDVVVGDLNVIVGEVDEERLSLEELLLFVLDDDVDISDGLEVVRAALKVGVIMTDPRTPAEDIRDVGVVAAAAFEAGRQ
jgi:hypothetical protein